MLFNSVARKARRPPTGISVRLKSYRQGAGYRNGRHIGFRYGGMQGKPPTLLNRQFMGNVVAQTYAVTSDI
jgi:hypothetical protein